MAIEVQKKWAMTFLFALILIAALLPILRPISTASSSPGLSGNSVSITKSGETIGISDGMFAFDVGHGRIDGDLKLQASAMLKNDDIAGAISLWHSAARSDSSDAEALIYLEDQRVIASGRPYITLVIGTTLTGNVSAIGTGRDTLQGAYLAQKEYNDGLKLNGGTQVRLLIANAGGRADNVAIVAQQIVQAARRDQTIIGVMGWPYSAYTHTAIPVLSSAKIPLVSPTASADDLTNISPFFFRVAPANETQAVAGANYARDRSYMPAV